MLYTKLKKYLEFDDEFFLLPNQILDSNINCNSKIVFAGLHFFRGENKKGIKATNDDIQIITGINERTVNDCLKELQDNSYLTKSGRGMNRIINPYISFEKIQRKGDYTRIPSTILEHEELNSVDKIFYTTLLQIQMYKLNLKLKKVDGVGDLFSDDVTRRKLSFRMKCSKNKISELTNKLIQTKSKESGKSLLFTYHKELYRKKNKYCCNIVAPTTKKGHELLKLDLGKDKEIEPDISLSDFI